MSEIRLSFEGALEALNPECANATELYRLHWMTPELFLFQWARAKKCVLKNDEVASLVAVPNRLTKSEERHSLRSFLASLLGEKDSSSGWYAASGHTWLIM